MRLSPRWRVALTASAATIVLAAALVSRADAATLFSDDFNDGNASGWTTSGGSWSVGSGTYQQSGTSSDARARAGSASWTNYTVTARVRPNAFNGSNRFVALLARAQSNTSYYYLALRSNNTVELKKLVGGAATTLASASVSVSVGTWYTLSLKVSGSALTGQVNGGTTLSASDTQFASGQLGLATFNASASFDDVAASSESGTPPSSSPPSSPPPPPPGRLMASPPGQRVGLAGRPSLSTPQRSCSLPSTRSGR